MPENSTNPFSSPTTSVSNDEPSQPQPSDQSDCFWPIYGTGIVLTAIVLAIAAQVLPRIF